MSILRGMGNGNLPTIHEETEMGPWVTAISPTPASPTKKSRATSTWKSIAIAAFTGIGGLLFGYDTGYINGVMAMPYFENMYLGYSLHPKAVTVTDRDGDFILDMDGSKITGPISINDLWKKLPPNEVWLETKGDRGYLHWESKNGHEDEHEHDANDGEQEDKGTCRKRNVVLEAFRYQDSRPPVWIRIARDQQPFFVKPLSTIADVRSNTTVMPGKPKKDLDGSKGKQPPQPAWFRLPARDKSLIVGLLSLGTCIGALLGSDGADYFGRRIALISGCAIFIWGVIKQTVSNHMDMLGMGRIETGAGMGVVSTVIILYMCEISPARMRGYLVAWYQLCITIGLLMSACVNLGTRDMWNSGSFRIPISLQIVWAVLLGIGLLTFLPESPRWYVKVDKYDRARQALAKLRCQEPNAASVTAELQDIIAGHEAEMRDAPPGSDTYLGSWAHCFQGSWRDRGSNLRRTLLGAAVQMFQQFSGVNFVFYFGTAFFKQQGFNNVFLIVVIMSAINVLSTLLSFGVVTQFRRRTLLITGAIAMALCQFMVAGAGLVWKLKDAENAPMKRLGIYEAALPDWAVWPTMTGVGAYLFFYAVTWGPGAWILVGEIFPMQIRARGIGIATSTNWLINTFIAFVTPVLYDSNHWNLGSGVFFIWGGASLAAAVFAYFFVPETKGLTLEQVDIIFEFPARRSSGTLPLEPKTRRGSETIAMDELSSNKKPPIPKPTVPKVPNAVRLRS